MRRTAILVALVAVAWTGEVSSYTRPRFQIGPDIKQSRWSTAAPNPIVVNVDPPNLIVPGSQPFLAVRNALEMRSAYSAIRFAPVEGSAPSTISHDGTSLVTFKDTSINRSVSAGFGAVTFFWTSLVGGEVVVTESDIVFNPVIAHSTTGFGGSDIESLASHELTHFLSLEHCAILASSGYPYADLTTRSLEVDDVAGTEFLYPFADTPGRTGSLSGTVLENGTTAVFGAQVTAVNQSDGIVVNDTSVTGGVWRIDALPPGSYTVYAEPCDGPCYLGLIDDGVYGSTPFDTSFRTQFAGGNTTPTVFNVTAGGEASGIAVAPSSAAPTLNPRMLGLSPNATTPVLTAKSVVVAQGASAFLTVSGPGIDLVPNDGLSVTGPGVAISSTGVARGTTGDGPYMIVSLTVDPSAPRGTRSVLARDATSVGAITGGFEVAPSTAPPGLLRSDQVSALTPITPPLASIFPLETTGPDAFPGIGEGTRRALTGSDDDDDLYVPEIPSGYLDPDAGVASDLSRPLVFYRLTNSGNTLRIKRTTSGRIEIDY